MNDLYTVWTTAGGYRVVKFDFLLNVETVYNLSVYNGRVSCKCFRHKSPDCRHREIIRLFISLKRINRGYFYCYDTGEWQLPVSEAFVRVRNVLKHRS